MAGRSEAYLNPFGYEDLAVTTSSNGTPLTAATYQPSTSPGDPAASAYLSLEGGDMRWRIDGTAPSTASGHLMTAGNTLSLTGFYAISHFLGYAQSVTVPT